MDEWWKPHAVAIITQLVYAGMFVVSKVAFNRGLSTYVFVFYRQAAATILLVPLAFLLKRKRAPPLSLMVLFKMFMTAFVGMTLGFNVLGLGIKLTTATVASAATNSVPIFTFCLALLLRMETVRLKSLPGILKVLGIVFCVAGIASIIFITSPGISPLNIHHPLAYTSNHVASHSKNTWILGASFMILGHAIWSLWLVLQGLVLKEYPSKFVFTALQCLFSTFQSFFVALAFERNLARWKLKFDSGSLAIAYCVSTVAKNAGQQQSTILVFAFSSSLIYILFAKTPLPGLLVTGLNSYLQAWCVQKKGPVFYAIYFPSAFVLTTFLSSFLLGEVISLGSVLGGIFMVMGLYSVLWGKSKEINLTVEASIKEEEVKVVSPIEINNN